MNKQNEFDSINSLKKYVAKQIVQGTSYSEESSQEEYYLGLQVAIEHKLAPLEMRLTIQKKESVESNPAIPTHKKWDILEKDSDSKYVFYYQYLDLPFTIRTHDDKIAAKLYPYFSDEQKTQIMAMTLGSHQKEEVKEHSKQEASEVFPFDGKDF
jgi:hypothetical protein